MVPPRVWSLGSAPELRNQGSSISVRRCVGLVVLVVCTASSGAAPALSDPHCGGDTSPPALRSRQGRQSLSLRPWDRKPVGSAKKWASGASWPTLGIAMGAVLRGDWVCLRPSARSHGARSHPGYGGCTCCLLRTVGRSPTP